MYARPRWRPAALGVWLVMVAACRDGTTGPDPSAEPVTVVAVGDLVCGAATPASRPCEHAATASAATSAGPEAVLLLGDLQYEDATLAEFEQYFEPTWGVLKHISYPVPGNHEYQTADAAGYFDYFNGVGSAGGRAGARGKGYYAITLGAWRVIALNSNCAAIGGCAAGSPQEQWLRAELAATRAACTLAFWHHPPFTSSARAASPVMLPLWRILVDHGVDVVLTAHEHQYERFAPMDANGARDAASGTRMFVVGTGGRDLHLFGTPHPASEARNFQTFGVLRMVLRATSYEWTFVPVAGGDFSDTGSHDCTT